MRREVCKLDFYGFKKVNVGGKEYVHLQEGAHGQSDVYQ